MPLFPGFPRFEAGKRGILKTGGLAAAATGDSGVVECICIFCCWGLSGICELGAGDDSVALALKTLMNLSGPRLGDAVLPSIMFTSFMSKWLPRRLCMKCEEADDEREDRLLLPTVDEGTARGFLAGEYKELDKYLKHHKRVGSFLACTRALGF